MLLIMDVLYRDWLMIEIDNIFSFQLYLNPFSATHRSAFSIGNLFQVDFSRHLQILISCIRSLSTLVSSNTIHQTNNETFPVCYCVFPIMHHFTYPCRNPSTIWYSPQLCARWITHFIQYIISIPCCSVHLTLWWYILYNLYYNLNTVFVW